MSLPITIRALERRRPGFRLGPVSCDVRAGGRLAIVGPSGSGKTTLLRTIAGLDRADAGTISVGERRVAGDGTHVPPAERGVGLVFQDGALWPHMTALAHLTFAAPGLSKHDAMALLAEAGLAEHAHKRPGELSGGEAQRLGLLRALAPRPQVLLLDEPLRSVDVHQRDALVLLLRRLCDERDVTSVLVTHDRDEALALADELMVMRDGHVVEAGSAAELLERPRTAFTAAFLRGAACLPTTPVGEHRVRTAFGEFDVPAGSSRDLRLVLFPGDVEADVEAGVGGDEPTARVLARLPGEHGLRCRVAVDDQLLIANAAPTTEGQPSPNGTTRLRLNVPPRLLPWQLTDHRQETP